LEDIYGTLGVQGLMNMLITLACIGVSWWALQAIRFDLFVKDVKNLQSRVLQVILAIVTGYLLGQFLISYSNWSSLLKRLF
jgi:uncharacterized integral membrane protein (TIGR02327 family)